MHLVAHKNHAASQEQSSTPATPTLVQSPPSSRPSAQCTHRVPDLQLDLLAIYVDHARPKLHANSEVVHWLEPLVCELQQQARLAHTCRASQGGQAAAR